MIAATEAAKTAVKYSHPIVTRVDVYRNGTLTKPNVPVIGGEFEADRDSKIRWSSSVDLALLPWEATGIDAKVCRFRVFRGIDIVDGGMTQLGEYRVNNVSRAENGVVSLRGTGLESYLVDGRFVSPRTPPYGTNTTDHITTLIREVLPDAVVVTRNTRNKPVQATAPWERERWDAINALAQSIDCEVYADNTGTFIIADIPSVTQPPSYIFDEGPEGVLVYRSEKETRDRVYNAVVVTGQSSDPAIPPVWGWAYDDDPTSPTYFYGPFGQVPRFFSSQFFTTEAQCTAYARTLLAESLAENRTIDFTSLQLDFVEPGDVVGVRGFDNSITPHLLQVTTGDLGVHGKLTAKTLSAKSVITDGV